MLAYLATLALLVPVNAVPLDVRQATSPPVPVDPYPYTTVAFTNDWPLEFRTGEVIQLRWTGGSGVYDLWQLDVKPDYDVSTALSYIVVDDTVVGADYTIVSGGCFREDSFLIFGLQESGTNQHPAWRKGPRYQSGPTARARSERPYSALLSVAQR